MKRPPSQAEILPVGEEHLPALAELAGVIWRQHYPGIISHEQIDYMLGKMYALDTLRGDLGSRGILFYRLVVDGRLMGFASIGPLVVGWLHDTYGGWSYACLLLAGVSIIMLGAGVGLRRWSGLLA